MSRSLSIVSLVSSATEILYALDLGDNVVGVSHECDWPSEVATKPRLTRSNVCSAADSASIDAEVRSLLSEGALLYELDVELLESLRPDLVITQAQCDVCAVRYDDVVSAVKSRPALAHTEILELSPKCLTDVLSDIERVGLAADCSGRSREFVSSIRQRVSNVPQAVSSLNARHFPRTCVIEWFDPLIIAGNWVPELIKMAGGRPGLSAPNQHSPVVSWDDLAAFDPEVLILAPCGFDVDRARSELQTLIGHDRWPELSAARCNAVHIMDGNAYFNRPGPRLVDSVEVLAHLIHGDQITIPPWIDLALHVKKAVKA
jgi:iron complex transport system substrate-binding protein